MSTNGFKILEITAENHKSLRAVRLQLDGANLHVAGKTGQGKTTAISALWDVLEKAADPITHGETKSRLRITLGDPNGRRIFAERVNTPKSSTIKITTSEGDTLTAKEFKEWLHSLAVNPHQLMQKTGAERVALLLEVLGLRAPLQAAEAAEAAAAQERLLLHRQVQAAAAECGVEPPAVEPVDIAVEMNARNVADSELRDLRDVQAKRDGFAEELVRIQQEQARLNARALELADKVQKGDQYLAARDAGALVVKLQQLDTRLREAAAINEQARARQTWDARQVRLAVLQQRHQEEDNRVKELQAKKGELLQHARFPIPELELKDGALWFKGTPLEQCGTSQQLLVCTALAAAVVANSKIQVVRMDGVESMSPEDQAAAVAILNAAGCQVLTSRVSRDGTAEPGEIIISEGEVV